jgi:hypothetical protein
MGLWDIFGFTEPSKRHDDTNSTFECDYDKNCTTLYKAIENGEWVPALDFMDTGKWADPVFQSTVFASQDPLVPERQARTWVTRYEENGGAVRWSQLPLHAALIFGAPLKIIETLLTLYPQGVRCTDDRHMLPLHLAIKHGSEDSVLRLLVERFPEAITTKEAKGRLPILMEGPRHDRTKVIEGFVAYTTKTLRKQHETAMNKALQEMKEQLKVKDKLLTELELHNNEFELAYNSAKSDIERLQSELAIAQDEATCVKQEAEIAKEEAEAAAVAAAARAKRMKSRSGEEGASEEESQATEEHAPAEETVSTTLPKRKGTPKGKKLPRRKFFTFGARE